MVRSFRRGALAAAVVALSVAPLAACGAGYKAETQEVQPDSQATTKGDIQVQNAFVLTQPNGPATVTARLFNNGTSDQTLDRVKLSTGQTAQLTDPAGSGTNTITVPAHGSVLLGGKGNPAAVLSGATESLRNGDMQGTTFTFSGAGDVSLPVNVMPAAGYLEPYGPGSVPTTEAPTPTSTDTASPGDTSSPTSMPTSTDTAEAQ